MPRRITINDVRRAAAKAGGTLESDGCGGWELLAPADRRWVWTETQCQPLPVREWAGDEVQDELQRALDICTSGHEPYAGGAGR